jgi:hypothetical protein
MPPTEIDKVIHGRFCRLFLEHRDDARIGELTDQQIIEQAGAIFLAMMSAVVSAARQGDQKRLDGLAWFTRACAGEIDETARARLDG